MNAEPLPRDEVAASVSAMRDLGTDYDGAVAEALAERLEQTIDARVEARLAERAAASPPAKNASAQDSTTGQHLALAIVSLVIGVPLTAVTAGAGGVTVAVVWVAIALINIAFMLGPRRRG